MKLTPHQKRVRRDLKAYRAILSDRRAFRNRFYKVFSLEFVDHTYNQCLVLSANLCKDSHPEWIGPLAVMLYNRCGRGKMKIWELRL